jgi:dTDP-L-rhamnose 4-epimerase
MAIFTARLLNGRQPLLYEDGQQRRDFVSVHDIALACCLALESDSAAGRAVNVGSGRAATVREVALLLNDALGTDLWPEVTSKVRLGDVRHCFADISLARELLAFEPQVGLEDGVAELAGWLEGQEASDRFDAAARDLEQRGLTL